MKGWRVGVGTKEFQIHVLTSYRNVEKPQCLIQRCFSIYLEMHDLKMFENV